MQQSQKYPDFGELDSRLLNVIHGLGLTLAEIDYAYAAATALRLRIADDYVHGFVGNSERIRPIAAAAAIVAASLHLRQWVGDLEERVGVRPID